MSKSWRNLCSLTFAITTGCFSFFSEEYFNRMICWSSLPSYWNETINKILFLIIIGLFVYLVMLVWKHFRRNITIKGHNYKVIVEYGDIFNMQNCKRVINFDECFSTEIGEAPHQIKPSSICGQFLQKNSNIDVPILLSNSGLKPQRKLSDYGSKKCYESGSLIPYGEYLLMAFGKLNKDGRAVMTRKEYIDSLNTLWREIDKHYTQSDVAIPVLGAGITRFKGEMLTQQQLIDIIVSSYQISPYKIKKPNSLHVICKKRDDFSLNKVGETL